MFDPAKCQFQNLFIDSIKDVLQNATSDSIPNYNPHKPKQKNIKFKVCSLEVKLAAKASRSAWGEWREVGSPADGTHPSTVKMKKAKKNLRSVQRTTAVKSHQLVLDQIMNAKGNDDKMFYRIIKMQRNN